MTNPIYPCLWLDGTAKEAAEYYCSIFKESRIISETPMVVIFEINHTQFMALNGGNQFKFNESISFVVECDTQEEIDHYWERLTAEGEESMCGWLTDKYGVSWQIVPKILLELMNDPSNADKIVNAFMQMRKLDIEALKKAIE